MACLALGLGAVGACSSPPVPGFNLSAPREQLRGIAPIPGQIAVVEPTALQPFEAQSIVVHSGGSVSLLGGGQWTDRLPRLVQTRMIETFENASRSKTVSRPGDGVTPDYLLNTEIRAFQLDAARSEAVVELSEKLVAVTSGKIVRARIFSARVPVASSNAGEVAQALDKAMSIVLLDIVRWVGTGR